LNEINVNSELNSVKKVAPNIISTYICTVVRNNDTPLNKNNST